MVTSTKWWIFSISTLFVRFDYNSTFYLNHYFNKQLVGLRRHLEFAFDRTGLREHNWPDIKIDEWDKDEIFQSKLQTDGYV